MKKLLKVTLLTILSIILVGVLSIFLYAWYNYDRGYDSIDDDIRNKIFSSNHIENIYLTDSGSIRRSGNTFMSIPEWYIVTISSDYTLWLESGYNPSDFPYFEYLNDMWYVYGRITAIMDGNIERDYEYHTMVRVIGLSTTLEFGLKALYEKSIGRLTSYIDYSTKEDRYYQEFSRNYVDFILLRPWYEFPFSEARKSLSLSGYNIRNIERYFIISLELLTKQFYARIIEDAAHSNFAIPDIWTYIDADIPVISSGVYTFSGQIVEGGIKLPRYYPFTESFPLLLQESDIIIRSIAGNTHIVSEFMTQSYDESAFLSLVSPINHQKFHSFYYTDIDTLRSMILDKNKTLLHIYDF